MNTPSPTPVADPLDLENYQVYSRAEILSMLRAILDHHILVTIYFNQGEEFLVTSLLTVNPDFEELVFDAGSDGAQNERLFASPRLIAVAFIDKIKVQFTTQRAEHTLHEGREAIRIRLPDSVLRLQRRDFYRVQTPVARPIKCSIACPKEGPAKRIEMAVVDVSAGGIGVVVDPDRLAALPGLQLTDFQIELGDIGKVDGTLEVRHVSDASHGSQRRHRLGCNFLRMPGTTLTLIQRYVTALERERLIKR